ncbi:hypothetical protein VTI28DRAFT_9104 [Corynascus sepedonium]
MENSTLRYEKNRSFGFAAGTEYWGSLPKTYLLACQTSSQYRRPGDTRYTHFIGKLPLICLGLLFIVEGSYVDLEFGTGALKLTPVHDFNDYKLGECRNLESINILNEDNTRNENAGLIIQRQKSPPLGKP